MVPSPALSCELAGGIIVDSSVRREGRNRAISALVTRGNSDFFATPRIELRHGLD